MYSPFILVKLLQIYKRYGVDVINDVITPKTIRCANDNVRYSLMSPCCILEQDRPTFTSKKVLVIPRKRWLRPDMTEKLLTGALSLNPNKNKQTNMTSIREFLQKVKLLLNSTTKKMRFYLNEIVVYSVFYHNDLGCTCVFVKMCF